MRIAEQVTFGGSELDRAAGFRGDPERQAQFLALGLVLPLWRGKPLFAAGEEGLGWVAADHPVLISGGAPLFLGITEDRIARFAVDISGWTPETGPANELPLFDDGRQTHPDLPAEAVFEDLRNRMAQLTPQEAEMAATARALLHWHQTHGFCANCGVASVSAEAGWLRRCPSCGAQHFPRTDPVVIMLITSGNRLLVGRNAAWPKGMFSLLAGFVEPGETIEAAVRREVFEESGVKVGPVGYLASQPWPYPASLMLGCRGEAVSEAITVDPNELEEARWVSREEMVEVFAGRHPEIKPGRKGAIAQFLMRNWLADRLD